MLRHEAITKALEEAMSSGKIMVVYGTISGWAICEYAASCDMLVIHVDAIRYVLPHGEVTKLS